MKKIFLFTIVLSSYFSSNLRAQDGSQRSVAEILNPDGTIQKGAEGSFNTQGFEMRYGKNGEPIFLPQNTMSGTWYTLGTGTSNGVNGRVDALAMSGDNLFVGGSFSQAGGQSANNVARYNLTTNTWHPLGTVTSNGVGGSVFALAVSGENVFVGGFFTQAGGQVANNVARFNMTTGTWHSLGTGTSNGVNNRVYALAVSGENVFVGGWFKEAGGQPANYVARYNLATNTWHILGTGTSNTGNGVSNYVLSLAALGENVFVGGRFSQASGQTAKSIARYNLATNTWHPLGTGSSEGVGGTVFALAVSGENVFVGGEFTQAGGQYYLYYVARYNLATDTWYPLGTSTSNGVGARVYALAVSGENVFVGGDLFGAAGVQVANRVARFNLTSGTWHSLGTGTSNGVGGILSSVYAIGVSGENVFVGGQFIQAGGLSANYVARYTEALTSVEEETSLPTSFRLLQNYPNPFNPSTTISFTIPNSEFVTLKVYDMLGREVTTIVNDNLTAGSHSFNFDASNLTSGVYFYKLQAGKFSEVKKMILMK